MRVEFLLEEPSMAEFLRNFLPRILPTDYKIDENVFLRPHNGKSDLIKSIPNKVRAFSKYHEPVKIVILQDQDNVKDCKSLKKNLQDLCKNDKGDFYLPALVRIVCQELESWYLGDLDAVESAYPNFKAEKHKNKKDLRNPDLIEKPSKKMGIILPDFQKVQTAKKVSNYIDTEKNTSTSFQVFVSGLRRFLEC